MERFTRVLILWGMCLGCVAPALAEKPGDQPRIKLEFRRAERKPAEGLIEAIVAGTKEKLYLQKTADATNQDVADAVADRDAHGQPMVAVSFTKEGAAKMQRLSEQHLVHLPGTGFSFVGRISNPSGRAGRIGNPSYENRSLEHTLGKPLAILVDGKVISAPVVREKFGGLAQITGLASKEEAQRIVKGLKAKQ